MSDVVERYLAAYAAGDHDAVGACLTDDVVWEIPGHRRLQGREAFLDEMRAGEAAGLPDIRGDRFVAEGDTVVVQGRVRAPRPDGGHLHAVFADVFTLRAGRISALVSYVVPVSDADVHAAEPHLLGKGT